MDHPAQQFDPRLVFPMGSGQVEAASSLGLRLCRLHLARLLGSLGAPLAALEGEGQGHRKSQLLPELALQILLPGARRVREQQGMQVFRRRG